jgi:hypothetical protein
LNESVFLYLESINVKFNLECGVLAIILFTDGAFNVFDALLE